jgi:FAD synthase
MNNTNNIKNEENTIFFTIGRMNPPTTGHMLLIRQMILQALQNNLTQINIILSASVDNKKNPISCDEKRNMLLNFLIHHQKEILKIENPEKSQEIDNMGVKIICMNDPVNPYYGSNPILKSIQYILTDLYGYPRENIKMVLFIGEDRKDDFFWIQKSLQNKIPSITMEIIGLDRPEGAMSATYIRQLAINGNFDEFKNQMLQTGLNEPNVIELYNEIREKINLPKPKTQKTKKGGRRKVKTYRKTRISRKKSRKNKKTYKKKT